MEIVATGVQPTSADASRERQFVQDCLRPKEKHYQVFNVALDRVIDFILNRQLKIDRRTLLKQLSATVTESMEFASIIDRFVVVAEGLGRSSSAVAALRRLVNDVSQR